MLSQKHKKSSRVKQNNMQYAGSFMNTTAKQFGEKTQHTGV